MCGIFAWWPQRPDADTRSASRRALAALAPRGPDGEGLWSAPDDSVHLGHRRLAITGERGAQPLWNADRTVAILVNGEFYDAAERRRYWERLGHLFRSDSDSELLLPLYEAHGEHALTHLEGEFAGVLWDARQQTAWFFRDRSGVKPLRVACGPLGLAAASEAKALFAAGWPAAWDEASLAQALALQYPDPSRTLFSGIGQLEPGEHRLYRRSEGRQWTVQAKRWWRWFPHDEPELQTPSLERATQALTDRLEAAVDRRLETPWPVAVHVSAGLDSSAILALTRARRTEGVHAFSVGFETTPGDVVHDESGFASQTAATLGVPWTGVQTSRVALLEAWGPAIAQAEGLAVNGHVAAKRLLAQAVQAAGFKVVLTGEGADEALLGYAFLTADAAQTSTGADVSAVWAQNPVALGSMLPDGEGLDLTAIQRAWGWVPTWVAAKAVLGARLATLMKPEWRQERLPAAVQAWAGREPHQAAAHRVHQAAAAWGRRALGGYILPTLADAPEAGMGIEGRLPFLDAGVLSETARWHPSVTGWPHTTKQPLRELLKKRGLAEVAARPKHPFEAPPLWSDARVRASLRQMWSNPLVWEQGPFDALAIRAWMDRMDAGTPALHQQWEPVVATLLSFYHLCNAYGLGQP